MKLLKDPEVRKAARVSGYFWFSMVFMHLSCPGVFYDGKPVSEVWLRDIVGNFFAAIFVGVLYYFVERHERRKREEAERIEQ